MQCKELDERTTCLNEDLGFSLFCNVTAERNKEKFVQLNKITLQFNYYMMTDRFLPNSLADEISLRSFEFAKKNGKLDILNRIKF